ncbi:MAG TPA: limonene-1,2-epoxide hydrolase family protein [Acidimicrobiales bacterium]|nr:limonene-1,2-epoxide hydrolase family protein [Acidimicrobiales bacterium]
MTSPTDTVTQFCAAWPALDIDALVGFFADDAVYHNIPVDPVVGREAIELTIAGFTTGVQTVEFEIVHLVADGPVVLTERIDRFTWPSGDVAELPVMGTFEVHDGKITQWRDYFDMQQFMSQLPASDG